MNDFVDLNSCLRILMRKALRVLSPPIFTIVSGAAEAEPFRELPAEIVNLWPYHSFLVTLGFLLLLWGMTVARRKEKGWLKRHKSLGILGAALAVFGMLIAAYMVSAASQEHLKLPHAMLGAFVVLMLIINLVLGLLNVRAAKENRPVIRRVHRLLGRAALLLMALNMLFGMMIVGYA